MLSGERIRVTPENISDLKNQGERVFAEACLHSGCILYRNILVGTSIIDFLVINPKANTQGKLVEVTMEKRQDQPKKFIHIHHRKNVYNTTGQRKQRQIDNMRNSGHKWTILFSQEISNISKRKSSNS